MYKLLPFGVVELMETILFFATPNCLSNSIATLRGSGINGNHDPVYVRYASGAIATLRGSGINGNSQNLLHFCNTHKIATLRGSGINGNF